MLFDLRGRGRRRTVQVVYLGLALLFGVGFIGFGVGVGGGGGGLLNFLSEEKNAGTSSFATQIKKQKTALAKNPNDAAAWAALVTAQLHEAGSESDYESTAGKYTSKGKELLGEIAGSWSHYLALDSKPSPELAGRMLTVFAEEGLNQPVQEVEALQIFIPSKPPSTALFGQLALYAYKAKNTREGDLASAKAVALAAPNERKHIKEALKEIKKNAAGSTTTTAGASAGTPTRVTPTTGTPSTVTVGGATTSTSSGAGKSSTAKK
jgi:hypothetical protein